MSDKKSQQKADRLKAALKENLKRRKAQARGRQAQKPEMAGGQEPNRADDKPV